MTRNITKKFDQKYILKISLQNGTKLHSSRLFLTEQFSNFTKFGSLIIINAFTSWLNQTKLNNVFIFHWASRVVIKCTLMKI